MRTRLGRVRIELVLGDPTGADARWAMAQYFAELDARFDRGFDPGEALDEAIAYEAPTGAFVLARDDDDGGGAVAGCGAVVLIDASTCEIKRMWISPSARGRGVGRRLLRRLEDEGRALGATTVVLDTNGVLVEAIAMYESSGYHPVERYNDNPYAERWFAKSLAVLPPSITSAAVDLRRWEPSLVPGLAAAFAASEPELRRWMPHASSEQEDAAAFVEAVADAFDSGRTFAYAVTADGEVVGYCNLTPTALDRAEIGYWIRSDRTGAGLGAAAITALVAAARTAMPSLEWIEADVHPDNVASRRLLATCGFEGVDARTLRRRAQTSIGQ
jgi:RimJ/RimL family protein N-acetyltransferase